MLCKQISCSVPNFLGTEFTDMGEPNLPKYIKCAEFKCCYIIDSTILVYYIMYLWYFTLIVLSTFICIWHYYSL
jgi:hypothetical protein